MSRRPIWSILLLLACAACSADAAPQPAPGAVRGILLITVDTLRADHVGGDDSLTPGLDRLASEGTVVETFFTPTPSTGPAHASLFTGLHPWRHGVLDNAVRVDPGLRTLAEIAHDQGYETHAVVSSFVLDPRFGLDKGFDEYRFEPSIPYRWRGELRPAFYARGAETTKLAERRLNEFAADPERRFLLFVHYFDPHFPYDPPPEFQLPSDTRVSLRNKIVPDKVQSRAHLAKLIRQYGGEVRYVDAQIDQLLRRLDVLGLSDDTAVVVTADHGEGLGDHAHLGHGANLFNELIHIPFLIRAPGIPAGRRLRGPAQLEDLYPTLASLTGAPPPQGIDGFDLLPWLRGETGRSPREAALGRRKTYEDKPVIFFEWRDDGKWIGEIDGKGEAFAADFSDPELEGKPAAGAPPLLRGKVGDHASTLATESRPAMDPEVEEGLRALGYIE